MIDKIYSEIKSNIEEILFGIIFIFGTKVIFFIGIIVGCFLFIRKYKKNTEKFLIILNTLAMYKFLLANFIPYGNIKNESFRCLIIMTIVYIFYKNINLKSKLVRISSLLVILYFIGIVTNYLSDGGFISGKLFAYENRYLLIPYLLVNSFVDRKKIIKNLIYFLSIGVFGYFVNNVYFLGIQDLNLIKGNLISIFAIVLPFTFFFIRILKNNWLRLLYFIIFIVDTGIVLKSGARTCMYSTIIVILIMLIIKREFLYSVLSSCFLGCIFLVVKFNSKFSEIFFEYKDFSTRSREYLMRAGIYTFEKNFLFGSGLGNTQKYFIKYANTEFLEHNNLPNTYEIRTLKDNYLKNFPDAHNVVIDMLAQNGMYGCLFVIIVFIFLPFKILLKYIREKDQYYVLIMSGIIGFLIAGQSWSLWSKHSEGVIYFIFLITIFLLMDERNDCIYSN